MLDIHFIRENKALIIQACKDKQLDPAVVTTVLDLDEKRRMFQKQTDDIRAQINSNSQEIKTAVQNGNKPDPSAIKRGKELKTQLKSIDPEYKDITQKWQEALLSIPNVPADEVPVGPDESGNVVIRTVGEKTHHDFEPKPHHELMQDLDMLEIDRAVNIGGFRSYFLKGDGVLLERALLNYATDLLVDDGFTPLSAPVLVKKEAMEGTGYFPWGAEDHYYTQDGHILAGTSEVALTAFHTGETLVEDQLPIKMVGISPCFRREVGTHGKDTQGIVRVHQFTKVEQVVYTVANEAETQKWHENMTKAAETLLKNLELPYQVLLMCTGDMGAGQRKKYDIETWFPAQKKYRETHSASYFNDFQSRRLGIQYQAKDGTKKFVYTLNNTMAASPRLLAGLVENYQTADGSIRIPTVLQPYMRGKKVISSKKE